MVRLIAVLGFCLFLPVYGALAQEGGNFGLEGHIFDAKTLQPLANVTVDLTMFLNTGLGPTGAQVLTNISGLYFIESAANPAVVTSRITATCRIRGQTVAVTEYFYIPQPNAVYHRDIFLTLPRGVTSTVCNL